MITASKISQALRESLFSDEEAANKDFVEQHVVKVEGIIRNYGFHKEKLETHRDVIVEAVKQLDPNFINNGYTFLNLPFDKDGNQWGEQTNAEELYVMAAGLGIAEFCLPRDMWAILPGAVPYVNFKI